MNTIFLLITDNYLYDYTEVTRTDFSIVLRSTFNNFETLRPLNEEGKTWFKSKEEADAFILKSAEKKRIIAERLAELEAELETA